MKARTLLSVLRHPSRLLLFFGTKGFFHDMDDEKYLSIAYKAYFGKAIDLKSPKGFNEKLQWLKINNRNPLYTTLVDKCAVKEWVANRIGSEHVIPTLGVWESVDDIDLSSLPDKFVLKTNHDSGYVAICHDRASFDFERAKKRLKANLKRNFYYGGREWPYKNVPPVVFAEEYLEPQFGESDLVDYKLFRFSNGRIITLVCGNRSAGRDMEKTFFDEEWNPLRLTEGGHPMNVRSPQPSCHQQMVEFADKIAEGFPFARVDFYESNNELYFGEITFFPNSGFERFQPEEWDAIFGSWIELPKNERF